MLGLPKPSELKAMFNENFGLLRSDLAKVQATLEAILTELRTQRGA